jgi:hypothetical protein
LWTHLRATREIAIGFMGVPSSRAKEQAGGRHQGLR